MKRFNLETTNWNIAETIRRRFSRTFFSSNSFFCCCGEVEFHITKKDHTTAFRMNMPINPIQNGHFCFRTDDIEGFKKKLEEQNIPYADYGKWALAGWYQIFFYDPDGNIIEVHQIGM